MDGVEVAPTGENVGAGDASLRENSPICAATYRLDDRLDTDRLVGCDSVLDDLWVRSVVVVHIAILLGDLDR